MATIYNQGSDSQKKDEDHNTGWHCSNFTGKAQLFNFTVHLTADAGSPHPIKNKELCYIQSPTQTEIQVLFRSNHSIFLPALNAEHPLLCANPLQALNHTLSCWLSVQQ